MKSFKDATGRDWVVEVTIGSLKAVRDLVKVDLWKFFDSEVGRVLSDPPLMVDVLYVLCKKQCEDRKMTDIDFGGLFQNDVLESAGNALVGAVIDFFPTSRQTALTAMVKKSEELGNLMMNQAMLKIDNLNLTDLLSVGNSRAS